MGFILRLVYCSYSHCKVLPLLLHSLASTTVDIISQVARWPGATEHSCPGTMQMQARSTGPDSFAAKIQLLISPWTEMKQ